jgi:hypothetical protein
MPAKRLKSAKWAHRPWALASGGFMAAAAHFDPQPIDAMFMATAATWGGFYGSVGQVATDANLSPRAAVIVGNQDQLIACEAFKWVGIRSVGEACRLASACQKFRGIGIGNLRIVLCFVDEILLADNRAEQNVVTLITTSVCTRCRLT